MLGAKLAEASPAQLAKLAQGWSSLAPSTVARKVSALRQFFGFLVDEGEREDDPTHALPRPVPPPRGTARRHTMLQGSPPSQSDLEPGCALAERCPHAVARCRAEAPELRPLGDGRQIACHRAEEIVASLTLPA